MMTNSDGVGTKSIGVKPATNVFHGVRFAEARGGPLTTCVTFGWHRLGLDSGKGKNLFRQLRQKVRRKWTYQTKAHAAPLGTFDDVGTHEAPEGLANTHWLIRVPTDMQGQFESTVMTFMGKLLPGVDLSNVVHFMSVNKAGGLTKYMLKGVNPEFALYFHMKAVDQGFVPGRGRTFVSRSLSFSARKEAAWKRKSDAVPAKRRTHRKRAASRLRETHAPGPGAATSA